MSPRPGPPCNLPALPASNPTGAAPSSDGTAVVVPLEAWSELVVEVATMHTIIAQARACLAADEASPQASPTP